VIILKKRRWIYGKNKYSKWEFLYKTNRWNWRRTKSSRNYINGCNSCWRLSYQI